MSIKDSFRRIFVFDDIQDDPEDLERQETVSWQDEKQPSPDAPVFERPDENESIKRPKGKVVPLSRPALPKLSVQVIEPRVYAEAEKIADYLLENQIVILHFRRMSKEEAKRILEFLSGILYAIKGDFQRIGDDIFLCTPATIDIEGLIPESFSQYEQDGRFQ